MQGKFFMQLLLILVLLSLCDRKPQNRNVVSELLEPETMELIKEISGGGEEVDAFMREVGQISELVSAFAPFMQAASASENAETHSPKADTEFSENENTYKKTQDVCDILSPVRNLADDGIYNALARAV